MENVTVSKDEAPQLVDGVGEENFVIRVKQGTADVFRAIAILAHSSIEELIQGLVANEVERFKKECNIDSFLSWYSKDEKIR
jgi:hypothetical protein